MDQYITTSMVHTQLTKKFMDDRLKFTGSIRYDKAQNYDGNVSPRCLFCSGGESRRHNFRGSFQTGFRNLLHKTSTSDLMGSAILLGSNPDNLTRYSEVLAVGTLGQAFAGGQTVTINGLNAYNNSYTATSSRIFSIWKSCIIEKKPDYVKPEQVKAFELGYRSS
jgi:outer membrane receptor protein involved in Fe transport